MPGTDGGHGAGEADAPAPIVDRPSPGPHSTAEPDVVGRFSSFLEHRVGPAALREGLALAEPAARLAGLEAALCRAVRRRRAWERGERRGRPRRRLPGPSRAGREKVS